MAHSSYQKNIIKRYYEHFDMYFYSEEEHQLQKAVSFAESAYDELSRRFDYKIQEPTPLIVYQTHSAFLQNNIII